MKKIALYFITFYQKYLSFDTGLPRKLGFSRGYVCMHYPTCSAYAKEAIEKYGLRRGSKLAFGRILRCRPGKEPTVDPLP